MAATIKVTAPGSVMLMGEHAVVQGYWAIACALDKAIKVSLTPRLDRLVNIDSALAQYSASLDNLTFDPKLSFVLKAIELQLPLLEKGFDLVIEAEFSHTLGLGSSAAVTTATIKALSEYTQRKIDRQQHLKMALAVVHAVQGRGSGTDLAASIYGGVIAYQVEPCQVIELNGLPELGLYYAGYKTKTADVLKFVAAREQQFSELYAIFYKTMNTITLAAIEALRVQDWSKLGLLMDMYQGQMDSLGVNDAALSDIVYQLRGSQKEGDKILGAKISGSGLGDCVISLGGQLTLERYQSIEINTCETGVTICE